MAVVAIQADQVDRLRQDMPADAPVTMLNLMRYRDRAEFPSGSADAPCSGVEAYRQYAAQAAPLVESMGAKVVFGGAATTHIVAAADEHWDDVLLVHYPSVTAFIEMALGEAYQSFTYLRTAALADSRLIAVQGGQLAFEQA